MNIRSLLHPLWPFALLLTLYSAATAGVMNNSDAIRVGGSAESLYNVSITDTKIVFTLFFNEVLKKAEERFTVEIFKSDRDLEQALKTGKLDAMFSNTLQYLDQEAFLNPNATYISRFGPNLKEKYYLLVRQDSGIHKISQLRNRRIILPSGHIVGKLFLDVQLLRQGLPESHKFFSEMRKTKESNTAVVDLFFRKTDAALVTDYAFDVARELNPQLDETLGILMVSEPFVYQVISIHRDFPQARIDNFEPHILDIQDTPRMKNLMKTFRFKGLHKIDNSSLKEVRFLVDELRHLKGGDRGP
ncbi:MAG: PhnD/SsuA/transferrin family substrate-binding protein [Candidatus Thiodiazotropha sp. (ex Epidulcina cf. delphinae)]|nr:PhnD/SsuA/transferrin family substrate-binding protein [Candidatus Thiodiazotropha sp. (ex Epidulcina cf. delphinae)]